MLVGRAVLRVVSGEWSLAIWSVLVKVQCGRFEMQLETGHQLEKTEQQPPAISSKSEQKQQTNLLSEIQISSEKSGLCHGHPLCFVHHVSAPNPTNSANVAFDSCRDSNVGIHVAEGAALRPCVAGTSVGLQSGTGGVSRIPRGNKYG